MIKHDKLENWLAKHLTLSMICWLIYLLILVGLLIHINYRSFYIYFYTKSLQSIKQYSLVDASLIDWYRTLIVFISLTVVTYLIALIVKYVPFWQKLNQKWQSKLNNDSIALIFTIWLMILIAIPSQIKFNSNYTTWKKELNQIYQQDYNSDQVRKLNIITDGDNPIQNHTRANSEDDELIYSDEMSRYLAYQSKINLKKFIKPQNYHKVYNKHFDSDNRIKRSDYLSPYNDYNRHLLISSIELKHKIPVNKHFKMKMKITPNMQIYQRGQLFNGDYGYRRKYHYPHVSDNDDVYDSFIPVKLPTPINKDNSNPIQLVEHPLIDRQLSIAYVASSDQYQFDTDHYYITKKEYNFLGQSKKVNILNPKIVFGVLNCQFNPDNDPNVYLKIHMRPKTVTIDGISIVKMKMANGQMFMNADHDSFLQKESSDQHNTIFNDDKIANAYSPLVHPHWITTGNCYFWHIKGTDKYIKVPLADKRPQIFRYPVIHQDSYPDLFTGYPQKYYKYDDGTANWFNKDSNN